IAVSPPLKPWVPLHLDWEVEYIAHDPANWKLGEVDFDADPETIPAAGQVPAGIVLNGRALLTAGAAQTAAAAVRQTLARAQQAGGSASLKPKVLEQFNSMLAKTLLGDL